ncbi:MAG: hypothetical protein IJ880_03310 [Bacilli bacterium]|nr:hypothetical protein [Bacilli bacterium]
MVRKFRSFKAFMKRKIIILIVKDPDEMINRINVIKKMILKNRDKWSEEEYSSLCDALEDITVLKHHLTR